MPGNICRKTSLALLLTALLPLIANADHCTVTQVAVVPGTWDNTTTKTSLTLQTQDSSGVSCHVDQTLRFSLESGNAAGAFTSQTGGALQYYISSGSANRNFYYENNDTTDYVLTVNAGYGPATGWVESFSTTYSSSSTSATTTDSSSSQTTSSTSSASSSSASYSPSVHYSSSSLSPKAPETAMVLSAGRDRLGSVGSPLEFKVESDIGYTKNSTFRWNFGDGHEEEGDVLNHVYEYAGEYVVVLNASVAGRGEAVARIGVKIIEPELAIILATPERIEIKNNSKQEISLFGRALWSRGSAFVFPRDTIIKAGQSISFSSQATDLHPNSTFDTQMMIVGNTEQAKVAKKIEDEKAGRVAYLQNQIALLQAQMATLPKPHLAAQQPSEAPVPVELKLEGEEDQLEPEVPKIDPQTQTASVRGGWMATLKKFFLRTR